jgi:hypothetical protein
MPLNSADDAAGREGERARVNRRPAVDGQDLGLPCEHHVVHRTSDSQRRHEGFTMNIMNPWSGVLPLSSPRHARKHGPVRQSCRSVMRVVMMGLMSPLTWSFVHLQIS